MTLEPIADSRSGRKADPKPAMKAPPAGQVNAMAPPGTTPPGTTPITLAMDRVQAIGVRTALVEETSAGQKLRVTAIVEPTEQGLAEVHVRSPGFVEKIMVNQTGITVAAHQPLFTLYSPEIYQAESEFVATGGWTAGDHPNAGDSARRKLQLLGMSDTDIEQVAKTKEPLRAITIYAPRAGYIAKKNVVAGSYVMPETALYEIQNLSQVYVVANVFQQDLAFVRRGSEGTFVPNQRPNATVKARVDLIYPTLNMEARTTRVRMLVQSPKDAPFRPGEYGTVEFATPPRRVMAVPRDAVVDTGMYTYVFVVVDGRFAPTEVVLGPELGEKVTIETGVSAGERVVSGATFLIDSESRLQASATQSANAAPREPRTTVSGDGPSCQSDFDRAKYPDKWIDCQKCVQIHHGMGSMEADCVNAIPKPWK
jgi:Cu(I)/Ag(I) efflux system membrane fusion protein